MQHVPEGVIQAPESPDAPALPGCRSISDDDLCPVYLSAFLPSRRNHLCRLSTGNGIWPSVCDRNGYAYGCPEFQPNIIHP